MCFNDTFCFSVGNFLIWRLYEIGLSENTVSRWCSNKQQPSLPHLARMAKVLDVDIRDLIRPTKENV